MARSVYIYYRAAHKLKAVRESQHFTNTLPTSSLPLALVLLTALGLRRDQVEPGFTRRSTIHMYKESRGVLHVLGWAVSASKTMGD